MLTTGCMDVNGNLFNHNSYNYTCNTDVVLSVNCGYDNVNGSLLDTCFDTTQDEGVMVVASRYPSYVFDCVILGSYYDDRNRLLFTYSAGGICDYIKEEYLELNLYKFELYSGILDSDLSCPWNCSQQICFECVLLDKELLLLTGCTCGHYYLHASTYTVTNYLLFTSGYNPLDCSLSSYCFETASKEGSIIVPSKFPSFSTDCFMFNTYSDGRNTFGSDIHEYPRSAFSFSGIAVPDFDSSCTTKQSRFLYDIFNNSDGSNNSLFDYTNINQNQVLGYFYNIHGYIILINYCYYMHGCRSYVYCHFDYEFQLCVQTLNRFHIAFDILERADTFTKCVPFTSTGGLDSCFAYYGYDIDDINGRYCDIFKFADCDISLFIFSDATQDNYLDFFNPVQYFDLDFACWYTLDAYYEFPLVKQEILLSHSLFFKIGDAICLIEGNCEYFTFVGKFDRFNFTLDKCILVVTPRDSVLRKVICHAFSEYDINLSISLVKQPVRVRYLSIYKLSSCLCEHYPFLNISATNSCSLDPNGVEGPSAILTNPPIINPTFNPSVNPSFNPTLNPSLSSIFNPTANPSVIPTLNPMSIEQKTQHSINFKFNI